MVGGPVPKRSEERRRRNKVDLDRVGITERVPVPPLDITPVPQLVQDFYDSLAESGQAVYYEPSDWQRARLLCYNLTNLMLSSLPSSQMYTACQRDMDALLVSEDQRRRVKLEIVRPGAEDEQEQAKVSQLDRYRAAVEPS